MEHVIFWVLSNIKQGANCETTSKPLGKVQASVLPRKEMVNANSAWVKTNARSESWWGLRKTINVSNCRSFIVTIKNITGDNYFC